MSICGTGFEFEDDIAAVWPTIAARAARSRSQPQVLERIRVRCVAGEAVCLRGPEGVVILSAQGTADGRLVLTVLLAVSIALHGAFERCERAMLAIAEDLGADELAFQTDRRGWRKLLGAEWHVRDGDTFTRTTGSGA